PWPRRPRPGAPSEGHRGPGRRAASSPGAWSHPLSRAVTAAGWCLSGVSIEGEDAPLVAGVQAAGVGDVGVAGAAEGAGGRVADGGEGIGLVPGADPLEILGEGLVAHVVLAVLDSPVAAGVDAQVAARCARRGPALAPGLSLGRPGRPRADP